jgi:hypothetical protein
MGVGTPIDLLESVHRGVDMFDCIMPSQLAQRGVVFTSQGKLRLRRSVYKFAEEAIDAQCSCQTCQHYSRAYLHHLVKTDEILGWHLLTLHNLTFYHRLMQEAAASGCKAVFIGLETISQQSLDSQGKSFNQARQYEQAVANLHRHGIAVQAGTMFGLDGDDSGKGVYNVMVKGPHHVVRSVTKLPAIRMGRKKLVLRDTLEEWKRANEESDLDAMMRSPKTGAVDRMIEEEMHA